MLRSACFEVPKWHAEQFAEYSKATGEVARVAKVGDAKVAGFGDGYLPETFHRLYAESPAEVPAEQRGPGAAVRARLHDLTSQLPEFETLRRQTVRDPLWSGMAATTLADQIASTLPVPKDGPAPDADAADRILDGIRDLQEQGAANEQDVAAAAGRAFAAAEGCEQQAAGIDESAVRQALRRAVASAQESIEDAKEAMAILGGAGQGSGTATSGDLGVAMAMARKVAGSPKLRKIIEMAGRLRAIARAKKSARSEYARSELAGVEPTGDVARLLPTELGAFVNASRKLDLLRRVTERNAMGYKLRGREKLGKGPIIVGLDVSGSMEQNNKDAWAKAVSLAALDIARRENRPFGVLLFNGAVVGSLYCDDPNKVPQADLLKLLSIEPHGGTNFDIPILACLDMVEQHPTFKKADVLLVTDAEIGTNPHSVEATRARAKKLDAAVYGVLINTHGEKTLAAWCDQVTRIDDVSRDSAAVDLLFDHV